MVLNQQLYGNWKIDNSCGTSPFGEISMQFTSPNLLRYCIHNNDTIQVVYMTFKVDGDQLITRQISQPDSVSAVSFVLLDTNHLVIESTPAKTYLYRQLSGLG